MSRTRVRIVSTLLVVGGLALAIGAWLLASSSDSGWNPTFIVFAVLGFIGTLVGIGVLVRSRRSQH